MSVISPSMDFGSLPESSWWVSRLSDGPEQKRGSSDSFLSGELVEEGLRRFKRKKFRHEDSGEEPKMTLTRKLDRTAEQEVPDPRGAKSQQTAASFQVRTSKKKTNKYPGRVFRREIGDSERHYRGHFQRRSRGDLTPGQGGT